MVDGVMGGSVRQVNGDSPLEPSAGEPSPSTTLRIGAIYENTHTYADVLLLISLATNGSVLYSFIARLHSCLHHDGLWLWLAQLAGIVRTSWRLACPLRS